MGCSSEPFTNAQSAARVLHMTRWKRQCMTKMRAPIQSALPTSPRKLPYVAVLITVLIVAALDVLFVQNGEIDTLNHSGPLR